MTEVAKRQRVGVASLGEGRPPRDGARPDGHCTKRARSGAAPTWGEVRFAGSTLRGRQGHLFSMVAMKGRMP